MAFVTWMLISAVLYSCVGAKSMRQPLQLPNTTSTTSTTLPPLRSWNSQTFPGSGPSSRLQRQVMSDKPQRDDVGGCCRLCRRVGTSLFVCDPDRVLSDSHVTQLEEKVRSLARKNPCGCTSCSGEFKGRYPVVIGVMRHTTEAGRTPAERVRNFASNMRQRDDIRSDFDQCRDALYLALATGRDPNDRERGVALATGLVARRKISNTCADEILRKARDHLRNRRNYEALDQILTYYENAITGGCCGTTARLCAGQIVGIVLGVVAGVGLIVFMVVLCIGFCQSWECVVGTCFGVCIGCILGAIQACINAIIISLMSALCEALGCDDCCDCEPLDCVPDDPEDFNAGDGGGGAGVGF